MKHKLPKINELAKILNYIGYTFYKAINGAYYNFEVINNEVFIIRDDNKRLLIFKINNNGKIIDIQEDINNWFDFNDIIYPIIINGWEQYLYI